MLTVVGRVLDDGPLPLHKFRAEIRDDASANAKTYESFRDRVLDAIKRSDLLDTRGNVASALTAAFAVVLVLGSFFVLPGLLGGRPGGAAMAILIAVGMLIGAIILIVVISFRRVSRQTNQGWSPRGRQGGRRSAVISLTSHDSVRLLRFPSSCGIATSSTPSHLVLLKRCSSRRDSTHHRILRTHPHCIGSATMATPEGTRRNAFTALSQLSRVHSHRPLRAAVVVEDSVVAVVVVVVVVVVEPGDQSADAL